jgi:hypothetical protein
MKTVRISVIVSTVLLIFIATVATVYAQYETKTSLIDKFKTLCNAHSDYASYVSLGKSTLGKDIWIFRIGNPKGRAVMWDAQLHGNEDMGSEIELLIAKWLLESKDSTAQSILSETYVLFIPAVNIDSNTRTNANHVNLNRNFLYKWGQSGSTSRLSSEYRGSYAGSEKETQVMRNAFKIYSPKFYVNTHMWGGPRMYSWNGNNATLANLLKTRIAQISSQNHVTPYPTSSIYGCGYAFADAGYYFKACSFLLEINDSNTPSYSTVVSQYYPKCLPILIAMCQLA